MVEFDKKKFKIIFPNEGHKLYVPDSESIVEGGDRDSLSESQHVFSFSYDTHLFGCVSLTKEAIPRVVISYRPQVVPSEFLYSSAIKCLTIEGSQYLEVEKMHVNFLLPKSLYSLAELKSISNGVSLIELDINKGKLIYSAKQKLIELAVPENKEGRGYVFRLEDLKAELPESLSQEYNEIAWGTTNWARHDDLAADEKNIIQKHVMGTSGLEVGAGSGRVTKFLASKFKHLVATEYTKENVMTLKQEVGQYTNIEVTQYDVTDSPPSEKKYDMVMFWENGLGSILNPQKRIQAIKNMSELCQNGGSLILGLRELPQSPCEQLMIAAQNSHIMGIYHTFTPEEILSQVPNYMKVVLHIKGDARPAGGNQFFMILKKEVI